MENRIVIIAILFLWHIWLVCYHNRKNYKNHIKKMGKQIGKKTNKQIVSTSVLAGILLGALLFISCGYDQIPGITGDGESENWEEEIPAPEIIRPLPNGYDTAKVGELYFIDLDNKDPEKAVEWYFTYPDQIPSGMSIGEIGGDILWVPEAKHGGNVYTIGVTLANEKNSKKDSVTWDLPVSP